MPGRRTRSRWRSGPRSRSSPRTTSSPRPALTADPDEDVGEDDGDEDADPESERPRRRRPPIESVGDAPADPRLDMFRDFVNSLEVDPNAGGESEAVAAAS